MPVVNQGGGRVHLALHKLTAWLLGPQNRMSQCLPLAIQNQVLSQSVEIVHGGPDVAFGLRKLSWLN